MKSFFVYILANKKDGVLYVGVTSDLIKRIYQHKNNLADGFTRKYKVHRLVYFEEAGDAEAAITREKRLKKWNRAWKVELIEKANPHWNDLYYDLVGDADPRFRGDDEELLSSAPQAGPDCSKQESADQRSIGVADPR